MECQEKPPTEPTTMEPQYGEILPLSGKPYHAFVLSKSHVAPIFNMKWKIDYYGNRRGKSLDKKQWRKFVDDNHLKTGDACVFELIECSSSKLKFRIQILRGDIPFQLHDKFSGETKDVPILID